MPKSITHYYQESGRAGKHQKRNRQSYTLHVTTDEKSLTMSDSTILSVLAFLGRDGERADCILYYSYKDKQVLEGMIKKSSTNPFAQSTRRKIDQLYTCLRYCEDDFRCRRTMQLEFFGEAFDRKKCRGTCDNCREAREVEKRDLSEVACVILTLLGAIQTQKRRSGLGVTLLQLTELFRGSKTKAITKSLPNYASLQGYGHAALYELKTKTEIDRVVHAMIFERILTEVSEQNKQGFSNDYVQPGENAAAIRNGQRQFHVDFPKGVAKGKENSSSTATESKKKTKKSTKCLNAKKTEKKKSVAIAKNGWSTSKVTALLDDDDDDSGNGDDENKNYGDDSNDANYGSKSQDPAFKNAMLPLPYVMKLEKRILKVVSMWAEEERMMGATSVYCTLRVCLFAYLLNLHEVDVCHACHNIMMRSHHTHTHARMHDTYIFI